MPLYEYECDACGHRFEKIQKYSDPLETKCPTCGGPVHKLISSPAIQFKGSGFYITDYAKKDYVSASKAEQDGGKSDGSGKGEQTDTAKSAKSEKPASSSDTSSGSPAAAPAPAPAKSTAND
jgi:putative FmdB family regulatory protein